MRSYIAAWLLAPLLVMALSAATTQKSGAKTKPAAKPGAKHAVSHAATTGKKARGRGRAVAGKRKPARPSYQTHPAPERYKEIQQALTDKGYFKGEVNGEWKADSVDALKHFQADNQLGNDGKISSLSLIQLGLGPKRTGGAAGTDAPTQTTEAPPPLPSVTEQQSSTPLTR